jgi:hypothetical protein
MMTLYYYWAFYYYRTLYNYRTLNNHWCVMVVMMAWCYCYYRSVVVMVMMRCNYYRSVMVMTHLYSVMMTIVMTLC